MMKSALSLPRLNLSSLLNDFRNLNPQDVGAWPVLPRFFALIAVFFIILFAGWWFICSEQLETLAAHEQEEVKLKEEFVTKKGLALNLNLYKQQLNEIDRSFGSMLRQLPSKAEVESLLVEINQSGMGRGLQFELFKPTQEISKDFYAELPINIRLTGTYHDFGAFAADIAKLSRIVTLNNVSISSGQSKDKDSSVLVMETVAKTFRYLDDEELAIKKKMAQAAKGGNK